ncbi:hypothetical protein [Yinghuangia soli]|uniref:Uncharacterized protein n=1 Tax=Yinghuangia soli TaxID=2908204 RepID=A0AA41Q1X4_9ACTN|nr:hypothetical protein [Yinghuangia soli]MCF2528939.1 hypothetical protein [Yinghuangia soli]
MLKAGLIIAGSAVAVVGIGAVVGIPMAQEWLDGRHQQESRYDTGRDAKADRASMPGWLPDGTTQVRYKMKTTGGDRLLVAQLPDGRLPAECAPAVGHHRPKMTADWFPKGVTRKAKVKCGTYSGYVDGRKLVAWQTHDAWLQQERATAPR